MDANTKVLNFLRKLCMFYIYKYIGNPKMCVFHNELVSFFFFKYINLFDVYLFYSLPKLQLSTVFD